MKRRQPNGPEHLRRQKWQIGIVLLGALLGGILITIPFTSDWEAMSYKLGGSLFGEIVFLAPAFLCGFVTNFFIRDWVTRGIDVDADRENNPTPPPPE